MYRPGFFAEIDQWPGNGKRRLAETIEKEQRIDPAASRMSLSQLLELYENQIKGLDKKTYETRFSVPNVFKVSWTPGSRMHVRDVKEAQLEGWLRRKCSIVFTLSSS